MAKITLCKKKVDYWQPECFTEKKYYLTTVCEGQHYIEQRHRILEINYLESTEIGNGEEWKI